MKKQFLLLIFIFSFIPVFAQNGTIWQFIENESTITSEKISTVPYSRYQKILLFDSELFKSSLVNVASIASGKAGMEIELPNVQGELERFLVWESSNFEPELQAKYPDIRAYVGKGITDPSATLNFSFSPLGIQTMVFRADLGTEFIEPYTKDNSAYVVFDSKTRIKGESAFNCNTVDSALDRELSAKVAEVAKASNKVFKTLRLALSCTGEYGTYFGGTKEKALAAMNATMTRVNGVYERDLAVHLNIIANNDLVIYTNSSTDPYDNAVRGPGNDPGNGYVATWNTQLQATLTSILGNSAYDIGHLFGASGGGGNAGCIGCVCVDDDGSGSATAQTKGMAYTSPSDGGPMGDTFDIDYVSHEMGHQLGASHTFTYDYYGGVAQVEPGSGSTIMAYAGIVALQNGVDVNVQLNSDDYFTYISIKQIQDKLNTKSCPVSVVLSNNTPIVNAGSDYTIPKGTPHMLVGTVSDQDVSDVLTYCWEENDLGTATTAADKSVVSSTKVAGPNFRSFIPSASKVRYLPKMSSILANKLTTATTWESLYSGANNRTFNFTLTARDNQLGGGQTAMDAMKITVDIAKGPFTVTSQNTSSISYAGGSTQTVTWNVANTATLAGASTVDVLLSTDVNGDETTFTTIASGLSNNGSASVVLPSTNITYPTCRFMVKASGNIFFAVNSRNFAITANLAVTDFEFQKFAMYPNPSQGNFTIQFEDPTAEEIKVDVFDMRGRKIYENKFTNQVSFNENIQLNEAEAGVYLVTISDGNRKMVKRIIIE